MKIQVLRNLGGNLPKYTEGQIVEADEKTSELLISRGLAVAIVEEKKKPTPTQKDKE